MPEIGAVSTKSRGVLHNDTNEMSVTFGFVSIYLDDRLVACCQTSTREVSTRSPVATCDL